MVVSEEKARQLWCPEIRVSRIEMVGLNNPMSPIYHLTVSGVNTGSTSIPDISAIRSPAYCHCIAIECMMWTWYDPSPSKTNGITKEERRGYCGKAGRPPVE